MEIMGIRKFFYPGHLYEDFEMQVLTLESFVCSWKQDESKAILLVNWGSVGAVGDENKEKSYVTKSYHLEMS